MKTIEQKVLKFIDRHNLIAPDDMLLIALSGGPDSVFLLHFLKKFARRFKSNLIAVHINHQLRGFESDEDENFCKEVCKELGIRLHPLRIEVKEFAKQNKLSIEEAARLLRYGEMSKIAEVNICNKIVTAHNMNDNTETVLLNLFKGTGLSGISGIPVQRQNIIRPLLRLTKEEILEYLHRNKIKYRIDRSNLSNEFQRNYIRNEIIPLIKMGVNPTLDEAVFRSSEIFRTSSTLVDRYIGRLFKDYVVFRKNKLEIDLKVLEHFGKEVIGEIFKICLRKYFSHDYSFDDYLKLTKLACNQTGRQIQISKSLVALKERDKVLIYHKPEVELSGPIEFKIGTSVKIDGKKITCELVQKGEALFSKSKKCEFISGDDLDMDFVLRRWESGDRFIPLGMTGIKKVSDFLNEQKVPAGKKKEQLVLLNRNQIVWIVGLRIDNRYKILPATKRVYKLWIS